MHLRQFPQHAGEYVQQCAEKERACLLELR
jgi:hypothetical protein